MRVVHSLLRDTRAAAAAEMALALPMLFVLIFTLFEAGNYFLAEHKVLKGVREGARYAARLDFEYFDCTNSGFKNTSNASLPTAATIQTQIKNVTLTGFVTGGSTRVSGWDASDITINVSCNSTYDSGLYGTIPQNAAPTVQVVTGLTYEPVMGALGFGWKPILRAQSQAAVMGT